MVTIKYLPTWDSLKTHPTPSWLLDAKFGIYFHWGIYSVPACGKNGTWYPYNMYRKNTEQQRFHIKNFGDPSQFGYKDFIPQFTMEKFDPDAWAQIIFNAGAKFAGPVVEHHDGFSMWASKVNPWNAVAMGPKRDIVGDIAVSIKKVGLKLLVAFHHAENWYFYPHWEKTYDTSDPKFRGLYGEPHDEEQDPGRDWEKYTPPSVAFWNQWKSKIIEVIDAYRPDVMWFDYGLRFVPDVYKLEVLAYYFNRAEEWNTEVGVIYKNWDLPPNIGLLDFELGRAAENTYYPWITDSSVDNQGAWSYVKTAGFKTPSTLIHAIVDQVAKNGSMLLNFGPKPDGEIPQSAIDCLNNIGDWLKINGEAIYDTNPWLIAEEGPTKPIRSGGFSENREVHYTPYDIRFTVKGQALYIIVLGKPEKELHVRTLIQTKKYLDEFKMPWSLQSIQKTLQIMKSADCRKNLRNFRRFHAYIRMASSLKQYYLMDPDMINSITLLGNPNPLKWEMTKKGLIIQVPEDTVNNIAPVFRITFKK
jgi:alpha-L-fucosidase